MSILIVKDEEVIPYDQSIPLDNQIIGYDEIVVNYEPSDTSIPLFLSEVERISKIGIETKLSIKVNHNDHMFGFKVKQRIRKATNDITLNEIIKLMVLSHIETDRKLQDIVSCLSSAIK